MIKLVFFIAPYINLNQLTPVILNLTLMNLTGLFCCLIFSHLVMSSAWIIENKES